MISLSATTYYFKNLSYYLKHLENSSSSPVWGDRILHFLYEWRKERIMMHLNREALISAPRPESRQGY